jgi:hypothetical protein
MKGLEHWPFLSDYPGEMEQTSWMLWDTERYQGFALAPGFIGRSSYTMRFFQTVKARPDEGNMRYPGMLPAPQAFLIEQIRIKGVTRKMADHAVLQLVIGHKIYTEMPLDNFTRHQHFITLSKPLLLLAQVIFSLNIHWDEARTFHTTRRPKVVAQLAGTMLRPRQ